MQFRRHSRRRVIINITSLIDILFLLIIFFVVSSTFLEQPGMQLDLPEAESAEAQEAEQLTVELDAAGGLRLDGEPVAPGQLLETLRARVAARDAGDRALVLRADREVPHGRVVRVMDDARRAGIRDLVIATALPDDAGAASGTGAAREAAP
ncbi:MAG: biopolymer transporter ExbD [Candidatus Eiseniibacteriota bacterium]|jgi:biopolymer transport protein ExbD